MPGLSMLAIPSHLPGPAQGRGEEEVVVRRSREIEGKPNGERREKEGAGRRKEQRDGMSTEVEEVESRWVMEVEGART